MLQEKALRKGWILRGASAARGKGGGNSAGVGITVPKGHHPLTPLAGHVYDISPEGCEGRLVAGVIGTRRSEAILVLETYLWTTEPPMSRRNVKLLEAMATIIA